MIAPRREQAAGAPRPVLRRADGRRSRLLGHQLCMHALGVGGRGAKFGHHVPEARGAPSPDALIIILCSEAARKASNNGKSMSRLYLSGKVQRDMNNKTPLPDRPRRFHLGNEYEVCWRARYLL